MKNKVAVLMATYNGMPYIKEQINSILIQEEADIHIFISDDNSSDGTLEYVKELKNEKIKILNNTNENIGSAGKNFFYLIRNVDVSEYNYVALADQDDIWFSSKISEAIKHMNYNNANCYSSGFCAVWENGRKKYFTKSPKLVKYDYLFSSPGPGCTYVFKKDVIKELTQYISLNKQESKVQHHDWAIYAWARSMDFNWIIDTNTYIFYRQHSSNDTGVNSGLNAFRKRWNWLVQGWYTTQIIEVLDFIQYTSNFKNSIQCFRIGRMQFWSRCLSYRRDKYESLILLIFIIFNIVNIEKIKKSITSIESNQFFKNKITSKN